MTAFDCDNRPVVALTLGDPAGIGPELTAKLLAARETRGAANIVIVGDPWLWAEGQRVAGFDTETEAIDSFGEVRARDNQAVPAFIGFDTGHAADVRYGEANAAGGASVLEVLDRCMDAAVAREIDAICFAPLNKYAMKLGGLKHSDELHHFAEYLGVEGFFCEFNILGSLWTSRISSHVPLRDVPDHVTGDAICHASRLIVQSLQASGVDQPRVAVAGLNPHAGDSGVCGREEIDVIQPAVDGLADAGWPVSGPYPADTVFLRARDGEFDGVVTMYHDQGQIAIKLLGFSRGVTVQGGLSVPITTPAHGTAYDISGKNRANVQATANAFDIACRMGLSYQQRRALFTK